STRRANHTSLGEGLPSLLASIGVEPICPCGRWILNPLRLPIPPRGRFLLVPTDTSASYARTVAAAIAGGPGCTSRRWEIGWVVAPITPAAPEAAVARIRCRARTPQPQSRALLAASGRPSALPQGRIRSISHLV